MGCKTSKNSQKYKVPLEPEMPREPEFGLSEGPTQTDQSDSFVEASDDEKNSESLVEKPKEFRSSSESQNISSEPKMAGEVDFDPKTGEDHPITESDDNDLKSKIEPKDKLNAVEEVSDNKTDSEESSDDFDDSEEMTELRDLKYTEETGDNSEKTTDDSTEDSAEESAEENTLRDRKHME